MKKKGQTLEEFLTSLSLKIQEQQAQVVGYSTLLVDLTQELQIVTRDMIKKAEGARDDLAKTIEKVREIETRGGTVGGDHPLSEMAWSSKGRADAYLDSVTMLRDTIERVLGRKDETKH